MRFIFKKFGILKWCILIVTGSLIAIRLFPFPIFISEADTSIPEQYIIKVDENSEKETILSQIKGKTYIEANREELESDFIDENNSWIGISLKSSELVKASQNENVVSIEKDNRRKILSDPNDTKYNADQWNLRKIGLNTKNPSAVPPASATSGWDITTGNASTTIAIIDTGADTLHPDLAGNIWTNSDEVAGNSIDDDANGFVDDRNGYDFSCEDNNSDGDCSDGGDAPRNADVYDTNGHGTHVAGTTGAVSNNSKGVTGVCWTCKIMPLKVINDFGYGFDSDISTAIHYAVDNGASVINMSLGGGGYSGALQDAINYAVSHNVFVVAATGNSGASASDSYPSGLYSLVSVGATDSNDAISSFTNRGPKMDITAPGSGIEATYPCSRNPGGCGSSGAYAWYDGTSMAAPHISGLVGLIRSYYPSWSIPQIRYTLLKNLNDLGSAGFDETFGFGRANALLSLQASNTLSAELVSPTAALSAPGGTVVGTWNVQGTATDANLYIYTIDIHRQSDGYIIKQYSGRSSISNNTLFSINTAETKTNPDTGLPYRVFPDGDYFLEMRVEDWSGNSATSNTISVTINNSFPSSFTMTGPAHESWSATARPQISWQTSSDTSSAVTYDVYIDNVKVGSDLSVTSYTPSSDISEGGHYVKVAAKNAGGNTTYSNVIQIGVDISQPAVFTPGSNVSGYFSTISALATDTVSGIGRYEVAVDGGPYSIVTMPYNLGPLSNGSYTLSVKAFDKAGNSRTGSIPVTIAVNDITDPTALLNTVPGYVRSAVQFTGTANDENNVLDQYEIKIRRTSDDVEIASILSSNIVSNSNLGSALDTSAYPDGDYSAELIVTDFAGNSTETAKIYFTIDNTVPAVFNHNTPVNSGTVDTVRPTLKWNSTTDNFTSVTYDVYLNGSRIADTLSATEYLLGADLSDGNYSWYILARDQAGNSRQSSTTTFAIVTRQSYLRTKADFDGNGKVDLSDLSILAQNWQKNTSSGDTNNDGKVDLSDLSILAQNWQKNF